MTADRLLALYEKVAEAPDAVHRLRRFVLDLAVRGKLVPQDAGDEPASELVKDVEKKRKADGAGRKKKSAVLEPTPFDGELYDLPRGWEWVSLAAISDVIMGQSPPGSTYNTAGDGVPLINGPVEFTEGPFGKTVVNQFTTAPTNFCEEGDLLVCVRGSTTGRTNIAAFRACIGRGVAAIRSAFDDEFIRLFLWKSREDIIAMGRGIAFPSVSKKQIENLAVPLPPLTEQRRIVAKVEELMALLDRLEAARTAREATRDRLTTASLARLTAPDADAADFPANARFALATLPALTTRPDQIKSFRQTILNLAVRGKLVEQDPAESIAKSYSGQAEFDWLPPTWQTLNFGKHCDIEGGNQPPKSQFVDEPRPGYVRLLQIRDLGNKPVPVYIPEGSTNRFCREGEILIGRYGASVGKIFWAQDGAYNVALTKFVWPIDAFIADFVFILLKSDLFQDRLSGASRSAQAGFNKGDLRDIDFPLPPLAEQHRIVAKVDALMALCDRLEAALTTADTTRARLLEALLHEALDPAESVMEAAE